MYSAKEFANTLIDTSIVVILATALARLKADKGAKHTEAKLDLDLRSIWNETMFFRSFCHYGFSSISLGPTAPIEAMIGLL